MKINEPEYVSRIFNVECNINKAGSAHFIVRELFPNGSHLVHCLGSFSDLCQFFDTIKR